MPRPHDASSSDASGWRRWQQRLGRQTSFWGLLEYGIGPLLAIVSTPLLYRQLGAVGFGQFAMVMALAGFGSVANVGAAVTATKLVSERRHQAGGAHRGAAISFALILCALLVVTVMALAVLGVSLTVGRSWQFGGLSLASLIAPALAVYLCQQLDQLFMGCLKGREDFAAAALTETLGKACTLAAACLVAALTHSAPLASGAQALGLLFTAGAKMLVFSRASGRLAIMPAFDLPEMRKAFAFSGWSWVNNLSGLTFSSLDRVLVGALLGPTVLAIYTVGVQVGQMIHTVTVAIFQKTMPAVSRLCNSADAAHVVPLIRRSLRNNLLLSAALTMAALAGSRTILGLMLDHDLANAHLPLFRLLIVAAGLLSMNVVSHFSLLGLGDSKTVAVFNGVAGLVMVLALTLLAAPLGDGAAAWGRICYASVTLSAVWLILRRMHGENAPPRHAISG